MQQALEFTESCPMCPQRAPGGGTAGGGRSARSTTLAEEDAAAEAAAAAAAAATAAARAGAPSSVVVAPVPAITWWKALQEPATADALEGLVVVVKGAHKRALLGTLHIDREAVPTLVARVQQEPDGHHERHLALRFPKVSEEQSSEPFG